MEGRKGGREGKEVFQGDTKITAVLTPIIRDPPQYTAV